MDNSPVLLYNIYNLNKPDRIKIKGDEMFVETVVLVSIVVMVISIMAVLTVETLHATKNISKKRSRKKYKDNIINYTDLYRYR